MPLTVQPKAIAHPTDSRLLNPVSSCPRPLVRPTTQPPPHLRSRANTCIICAPHLKGAHERPLTAPLGAAAGLLRPFHRSADGRFLQCRGLRGAPRASSATRAFAPGRHRNLHRPSRLRRGTLGGKRCQGGASSDCTRPNRQVSGAKRHQDMRIDHESRAGCRIPLVVYCINPSDIKKLLRAGSRRDRRDLKDPPMTVISNRSFATDTQRHCAARRAGDHAHRGAMSLGAGQLRR